MTLASGSRLGAYEILSPLGAGGMGEVYRARDARLSREVAIKVLPSATASDPDRRARFEGEARAASALNHPNILTIYDIGESDGTVYIAMELVEGRTLRELLASGEPLPTKKLLDIAVQTAEGLAKAHAAGIVHRDLKPENLMISKDGFVKILDFGLAKLTEPITQAASVLPTAVAAPTQPGTVMGTAGYMSPEQASGHPVDFRSDQFTLGAILYEMATGQKAFHRKTGAETLVAIIREEPEPLGQLAPKAPAPVRWIVERCLAKDPEERYASTKDLARDLKSLRDHLTESSLTSASGALATTEPAKARRRGWVFPALLAFLLGGAAVLLSVRQLDLFASPPLTFQKITFRRGAIGTARFAQDGKTVVYGAAWDGGPMEMFTTNPESPESKSLGLPAGDVLAVSKNGELAISLGWRLQVGWETTGTLARVPLAGGAPREVVENVQDADWSPDGKELAVISNPANGRARLEFPVGKVLAESSGWLSDVRISPDGKTAAVFDHAERGDNAGRLVFVDAATGKRTDGPIIGGTSKFAWTSNRDVLVAGAASVRFVSMSGRGGRAVTLGVGFIPEDFAPGGTLLARRRYSRREMVGLAPGEAVERNLTWLDWSFPNNVSDDGKTVLFDEQSRPRSDYLCYLRKTDGSPAVLLGKAKGFDLSPDGRWALTTNPTADQFTLIPTGAGASRALPKANVVYQWAQFFPDGKRILFWANEPGRASRLYVQGLDEAAARPITPEGFGLSFGGGKALSPDGRTLLLRGGDGRVYVCPSDGSAQPKPLPGAQAEEVAWGWTGDGRSVYIGKMAMPARIEICDVTSGERRLWKDLIPPDPAGVQTIGPIYITPDGKSYVYSYRRTLDELFLVTGVK
jgi:eukaryotic-like serine/threonine-protein kinase